MHEKLESVLNSPYTIPAVVGLTGFASGLGLGFMFGKRQAMEAEILEFPSPDVGFEEMVFEGTKEDDIVLPPKVVIEANDAVDKGIITVHDLSELRSSMVDSKIIEAEVVEDEYVVDEEPQNDQEDTIPWDWDDELKGRTETAPYLLHQDEFFRDEKNYSRRSLTYFVGDNTLVDEDDAPIYNYSSVVGELNFGYGSRNKDTVFVRNDELKAEYEVTRVDSHYSVDVLGHEIEEAAETSDLKHSKLHRFRDV